MVTQANLVTIPALPKPLRWLGVPAQWHLDADSVLTFAAGQRTDWFIDPERTVTILNAPALLMPVRQPVEWKNLICRYQWALISEQSERKRGTLDAGYSTSEASFPNR